MRPASCCLTSALAVACTASDPARPDPAAATLRLHPPAVELDALGDRASLEARLDGPITGDIDWRTGDSGVAIVTGQGVVIAVANGSTRVLARWDTLEAAATVTVRQRPAVLYKVSGDLQAGVAGAELPEPLVARVTDKYGHPVAGVTVFFYILSGGGWLSSAASRTDGSGTSLTRWILGSMVGPQVASAGLSPGALTPARYHATASSADVGGARPDR